jgi:hypothetical protein
MLLTATSIPLSFLISFMILSIMGITLNIVVLFTLILVRIIVDMQLWLWKILPPAGKRVQHTIQH